MTGFVARTTLAGFLLASSALPALAQSGLCGGLGDNGQWLGGDEAASDISTSADYLEQMALVLQDNAYVGLFTLSAPLDVRIEAEARGSGDTVIEIFDAAGAFVTSDDDSGGNRASFVETALQPGTYCVSLRSYDGAPLTGFVRVGRLEHALLTEPLAIPPIDEDYGSDYTYAQPCTAAMVDLRLADGPIDSAIADGGVVSGIAPVTELRYWGFTLAAPAAISVTAENPSADPVITLYDSFGSWLAENDDFDGLNSRIDMSTPLQPGDYCVAVSALGDATAPVTVAITSYDPAAALLGMYRRGEAAPPLDGTYPITRLGTISGRVRQDSPARALSY